MTEGSTDRQNDINRIVCRESNRDRHLSKGEIANNRIVVIVVKPPGT